MFQLTNEQRKCFGLQPVESHWLCKEIKASPYDDFKSFVYIDGTVIRKEITVGENRYQECEQCEELSDDLKYLLPKTAKGKAVLLSSSALSKRYGVGMRLFYGRGYIILDNMSTQCTYYSTFYDPVELKSTEDFTQWVAQWCADTTAEDLKEIALFAKEKRKHVKFAEGDVFRFKLNRRLYGYGRILLDYDKMRKRKEAFWDVLMTKPVVCGIYHIATENKHLGIEDLEHVKSLPSTIISDNNLFYGDYEIIGNIPVSAHEDYPIMYGPSLHARERAVVLQWGKMYRRIENGTALFGGFTNNAVGRHPHVRLPILLKCIEENSNMPFWTQENYVPAKCDLRNPMHREKLEQVCGQFGISLGDVPEP